MNKTENTKDRGTALPWEAAFAKSLARLRLKHGMSQTELARRATEAGLPLFQQQIQRIENLARPVRLNEAVLLAQILNGDPWDMAAKMVDDESAFQILKAAQDAAAAAAEHATRTLLDEWRRLDSAVEEAEERLFQCSEYAQSRGSSETHALLLQSARSRQAQLTAIRDILRSPARAKLPDKRTLADLVTEERKA